MTYNPNSIAQLERVMHEIQGLVDRPRIQQKTWVAMGKTWLPILQIIHGELTKQPLNRDSLSEEAAIANTPQDRLSPSILIEVRVSVSKTFVNIPLADIKEVKVDKGEYYRRGAENSILLKNGKKYLTTYQETQRVIVALHKYNESLK